MTIRTPQALLAEVLEAYSGIENPRMKQLLQGAINHVHEFAAEVSLSREEWMEGIQFLTKVGQLCSDERQEYVLLSDLLGLSALVEQLDRQAKGAETPGSVVGPFHITGSPFIDLGGTIDLDNVPGGQTVWVHGRVMDTDCHPIAGAVLDIWQTAPNQMYAAQDRLQAEFNLRGKQRTDEQGCYSFITVKPVPYSVPRDGPCGIFLTMAGRHGMRAAHIHIGIEASGFKPLITEIFPADDPYLESDTVFGACGPLTFEYRASSSEDMSAELGATFDFVLRPVS